MTKVLNKLQILSMNIGRPILHCSPTDSINVQYAIHIHIDDRQYLVGSFTTNKYPSQNEVCTLISKYFIEFWKKHHYFLNELQMIVIHNLNP